MARISLERERGATGCIVGTVALERDAGWLLVTAGNQVERKFPKKCKLPPKKFTNARVAYLRY